jgi:hypothetical protein
MRETIILVHYIALRWTAVACDKDSEGGMETNSLKPIEGFQSALSGNQLLTMHEQRLSYPLLLSLEE